MAVSTFQASPGEGVAQAPGHDRPGGGVALVIIDMINGLDFENAQPLRPKVAPVARAIAALRDRSEAAGLPVIYVNDNFGQWHSEKSRLVAHARAQARANGSDMENRLIPRDSDYFIIKPQFSGFYATNLPVLLPKLGVDRLILTGIQTDICILFTAADAHMRDYDLWVPQDCVASADDARGACALAMMRHSMNAATGASGDADMADWFCPSQNTRKDG